MFMQYAELIIDAFFDRFFCLSVFGFLGHAVRYFIDDPDSRVGKVA